MSLEREIRSCRFTDASHRTQQPTVKAFAALLSASWTRSRPGPVPLASKLVSQQISEQPQPPQGHVRVVYLGPVAPHWEVQSDFGDRALIDAFRDRVQARLQLVPPHDPQFRRNRERVVRDAERENLLLDWDLGIPDEG
mgnify:CR=1 FL=1